MANHDGDTIVSNPLYPEVTARLLRIYPTLWNTAIAMRVDVVASQNGEYDNVYMEIIIIIIIFNQGAHSPWRFSVGPCK